MSITATVSNEDLVNEYQAAVDDKKMDILEKLYQQNRPFIYKIAKSYAATPEDIDDNLQDAFLILKSAADGYNSEYNNRFLAYLKMALIRGFSKTGNKNREIPGYIASRINKYYRLKEQFLKLYGREPTQREAEIELEITAEQYNSMLQTIKEHATVSMNDMVPGYDDLTVAETIEDPAAAAVLQKVDDDIAIEQTSAAVWNEVNNLPECQASAITDYYRNGKTQTQIAADRGQSYQYIGHCLDRGRHNLKSNEILKEIALDVYGIRTKAETIAYHGNLNHFINKGRSVENAVIYLMNHGL